MRPAIECLLEALQALAVELDHEVKNAADSEKAMQLVLNLTRLSQLIEDVQTGMVINKPRGDTVRD
jgi:Lhr-like helicase